MKIISAKMHAGLFDASASEETAEATPSDGGELPREVRISRWMLATLLAVVITGCATGSVNVT